MGLFKTKERVKTKVRERLAYRSVVRIDSYGFVDFAVTTGDVDGSGRAPGVQVEFEHAFSGGRQAFVMDAEEAELVARAIWVGAAQIKPHEKLRLKQDKWNRSIDGVENPSIQPRPVPFESESFKGEPETAVDEDIPF